MSTKKKPGKPSDFQGKRAEFLLAFYATAYADASKRGKKRGIWDAFFKSYWAAFPWRLPLTQDPDPEDPVDYARAPANADEESQKNKIIAETEKVSRRQLRRQRTNHSPRTTEGEALVGAAGEGGRDEGQSLGRMVDQIPYPNDAPAQKTGRLSILYAA